MPAYFIVDNEVTDPAGFEEYRRQVLGTLEKYGGKILVRGGQLQTLEGDWKPKRIVVTEFPSIEQARRCVRLGGIPSASRRSGCARRGAAWFWSKAFRRLAPRRPWSARRGPRSRYEGTPVRVLDILRGPTTVGET